MRSTLSNTELTLGRKLLTMNWFLVLLITAVASVGFAMLYLGRGRQHTDPWAERQIVRFGVALRHHDR